MAVQQAEKQTPTITPQPATVNRTRTHRSGDTSLSLGQIAAATAASTLGAVVAKGLGLWGTVTGTAILSVCATVGSVFILRAMRSTHAKVKAQVTQLNSLRRSNPASHTGDGPTASATYPVAIRYADDSDLDATQVSVIPVVPETPAPLTETRKMPPLAEFDSTDKQSKRWKRTTLTAAISSAVVFVLTMIILSIVGQVATGNVSRYYGDNSAPPESAPAEQDEAPYDDPGGAVPEDVVPEEDADSETDAENTDSPEANDSGTPEDEPTESPEESTSDEPETPEESEDVPEDDTEPEPSEPSDESSEDEEQSS